MKGYKATDENMQCRGFQFELGKWYEHDGEVVECQSGFHFCEQPSGVWYYYNGPRTRVFEVEAEGVVDKQPQPGADNKRVAKRIRFVREITPGSDSHSNTGDSNTGHRNTGDSNTGHSNTGNWNTGNWNTGNSNTGNSNTGHRNTGDSNTGHRNTGHINTGDGNTGHRNTGDSNTGDGNTGHRNTGDYNTGHSNTGYGNTGHGNTGDYNTGDYNTGYGNATSYSSGFFCLEEPKVICFDVQTEMTREQFTKSHPSYCKLCRLLTQQEEIDFEEFASLPGITPEKLKALHEKHIAARKA